MRSVVKTILFLAFAGSLCCNLQALDDNSWERFETGRYAIESKFWSPRIRRLVVNYVPFIMDFIENDRSPKKKVFARFKAVAERRAGRKVPDPCVHNWAEAAVYNTFESMCWALTVDPQGDPEIIAAQKQIREGIERWIPVILAAQEPDGYLCTHVQMRGFPRFVSPRAAKPGEKLPEEFREDNHEGYMMGYLIEAAIAHYRATEGNDLRMYRAAKKGADLFCDTIGDPPKLAWQPDHEGLEQAMARFSQLVNDVEGAGSGDKYLQFARWLLLNRGVTPPHSDDFRQKNKPLAQQKEPYGHAVMFGYLYSGAADVARLAQARELAGSADRIWESLVHGKMYLTGAIGSKDEAFGPSYVLPNDAKLGESCANIGNLLFQQNMNLLHGETRFADVAEILLYNGVLGSVALEESKWQYFNPLDQTGASFPTGRRNNESDCCMGNIPRSLLRLPSWIYAHREGAIAVNQFLGSRMTLKGIAGTDVEIVQQTDYPWDGRVGIIVSPAVPRTFAVQIRVPNRQPSKLYSAVPPLEEFAELTVNGERVSPPIEHGYAILDRLWKKGDRIELLVPLQVQRVRADAKITANHGRVALQYGPLIYNVESVDLPANRSLEEVTISREADLRPVWDAGLLGGVIAIRGAFSDGTPLQAIPNYARMNRLPSRDDSGSRSVVWIREP